MSKTQMGNDQFVSQVARAFGGFLRDVNLRGWEIQPDGKDALVLAFLPNGQKRWFCYVEGFIKEIPVH